MEEAAELYERAANAYKISKQWNESGNAYQQAAECHIKLQVRPRALVAFLGRVCLGGVLFW
jgi:alpha-soluble NSF attachment protein